MKRVSLITLLILLVTGDLYSQSISETISYGTAKVLENGVLKTVQIAAKPVKQAWEILEVAELTKQAVEESGVPFPDTRLDGIYSMELNGRDIAYGLNPVDGAKKVFILARIGGKALRDAVQSPIQQNLQNGSPKRFYSNNTIRYHDLITSFDINLRRIKPNTIPGDYMYLYLNNFDVNYKDFDELSVNRLYNTSVGEIFIGHYYYFLVYIKIGEHVIPKQRITWDEFTSDNFQIVLNLLEYRGHFDELLNSEISVVAELYENYTFNDNIVETIEYGLDEPINLSPPILEIESLENSINIKINDDSEAEVTELYRYSNIDPNPQIMDITCSTICADYNVEGGNRYYYYGVSKKSSYSSLSSSVVSGMPTTEYKFDYINYDPVISAYSSRTVTGRILNVFTGLPVEPTSTEVKLSIPDLGLVYPSVPINENGEFVINYDASTQLGIHEIRIEAQIDQNSIYREYEQEVVEADDKGRNLEITSFNLDNQTVNANSSISGTIIIENLGNQTESNGRLHLKLYSTSGVIKEAKTIDFSLNSGAERTVNYSLPLSSLTTQGNYQFQAEVTNSEGLDEDILSNVKYKDIYVYNEVFTSPTYSVDIFEFDTVGSYVNTNTGRVTLTDISSSGRVRFEFESSSSGWLEPNNDMIDYWESGNKNLLITPISSDENSGRVEAYLGVPSGSFISNNESVFPVNRGSTSKIKIYKQGGSNVNNNDVSFVFDENVSLIKGWDNEEEQPNKQDSDGNLDFNFQIDASEAINDYRGWIRLDYENDIYLKQIEIGVKPRHSLRLDPTSTFVIKEGELRDMYGNVLDAIQGMPLKMIGSLTNRGDFTEEFYLYNLVQDFGYDYKRIDDEWVSLMPDSTLDFEFIWNTTALPIGLYNGTIIPLQENIDLTEAWVGWNINLANSPPFDLDVFTNKNSYDIGNKIAIRATAERLGQALKDAKITADIEHPDGRLETLILEYDSDQGYYEAETRANLGGNYYIEIFAERQYYIPQSASEIAKVKVDLSPVISNTNTRLFENEVIEIISSPVGGVQGLAMDVNHTNGNFELSDFYESGSWVNATKQISETGSGAIIGVTSLGDENSLTSFNDISLGYLVYRAKTKGTFVSSFSNVSLIDYRGEPIITNINSAINLEAIEQKTFLSLSGKSNNSLVGVSDTLDIIATHTYQTYATNLELSFDPEMIEVQDVIEGSALGNYNSDSTIFIKSINQNSGNVQIGITRSNTDESLEIGSGLLGSIIFKPKTEGEVSFNFNKGELITREENESLPVTSYNKTLSVSPIPDSLKQEINLVKVTEGLNPGNEIDIVLTSKNLDDVRSIATTIIYDTSRVEFVTVEKGSFFSSSANLLFTNIPDSSFTTIGITELSDTLVQNGFDTDTLLQATFKVKKTGQTFFELGRTGLFDSDGNEIFSRVSDGLQINYDELYSVPSIVPELSFSPSISFADSRDELEIDITLDSVDNVYSFAGDITYDPNSLSFSGIEEGSFFSQHDSAQTSLIQFNDSQNGILTVGISRLGEEEGVSTAEPRILATLKFDQIGSDSSRIRFSKSGLLLSDGETNIRHETKTAKIGRLGDGFPKEPVLTSPLNSIEPAGWIEFAWQENEFNWEYQIQISDSANFSAIKIDTLLKDSSFNYLITSEDSFYWRARAINDYGISDWVSSTFETTILVPDQTILESPPNDSSSVTVNPLLIWDETVNSTSYNLQVSKDSDFNDTIIDTVGLIDVSYLISDTLNFDQQYFWRVRGQNLFESGPWSEVWSFKTIVEKPEVVNLLTPSNQETLLSIRPDLKWGSSLRADIYTLQFSVDPDFGTIKLDTTIFDTTFSTLYDLNYDALYYWRVKAINEGGGSEWSNIWSFRTVVEKPNEAVLVSPVNGKELVPVNPLLIVRESERGERYTFQLSKESDFSTIIYDSTTSDTVIKVDTDLQHEMKYYWRAKVQNKGGDSGWSEIYHFETIPDLPEIVKLIAPSNGLDNVSLTPTLRWKKNLRADSYQLQLSKSADFTDTKLDSTGIQDSLFQIVQLDFNTDYYWRVRGSNKAGVNSWSEIWKFKTIIEKPEEVVLISPKDSLVNVSITPTMLWHPSKRADKYSFQFSLVADFSEIIVDTVLSDTLFTIADSLLHDMFYYWRIQASNDGGKSNWSKVHRFKTIVDSPERTVLIEPIMNKTQVNVFTTFSWKEDSLADFYELQVSIDSLFNQLVIDTTALDTAQLNLDEALSYFTDHYWRVRGVNESGDGAWSDEWKFRTITEKPNAVSIETPNDSSTAISVTPVLKWKSSLRAESYHIQLALDSLFNEGIVDTVQVDTIYQVIKPLLNDRTYFWRVQANNVGGSSNWTVRSFRTIKNRPGGVFVLAPVDSSEDVSLEPTFRWTTDSLATDYWVQLSMRADFVDLIVDTMVVEQDSLESPILLEELTDYYLRVLSSNEAGQSDWSETSYFKTRLTTSLEGEGEIPEVFSLSQNYPNPFNPSTTIRFGVPEPSNIKIVVYNILGQKVLTVIDKKMNAGYHTVLLDMRQLGSGIYLYQMIGEGFVETKRLLLIK